MRCPDGFRQHVKKNDKGKVTQQGWTISQIERYPTAYQVRARLARRHSPLLWMLRLAIALAILIGAAAYLYEEDRLPLPLDRLLSFYLGSPVDSGNRNGLLHK
jgi:hypothetical protein